MKEESKVYVVVGAVLALSGAHYLTNVADIQGHDVFRRLYFLPIIYAAYSFGMRGGLATAAFASLLYLPFILFRIHDPAERFGDAFDAMTSDRPYRKALSVADALQEMKSVSGRDLDSEIVDLFVSDETLEEILAARSLGFRW